MRFLFIIFFVSSFLCTNAQNKIDVLHYQYQIELNDKNDSIKGTAGISFLARETLTSFSFDLSALNKDKRGMLAINADFNDPNFSSPKFKQENDKVIINCNQPIQKGDTTSIFITYKGIPADGLIISKNKYGKRTFFSDNWPDRAHNWIPCVDDPADKASVEFLVTAPAHYKVVSNGIQTEEIELPGNKKMTHWKEDVPLPTKVMVIGVADFAVNQADTVSGMPVSSWVFAENKTDGFKDYAPAAGILSFFINYIGPYPYKKLANVQSKTIFGGMENASAIFYFENSVDGRQDHESLLAHEIVHQWFGDMATEKSFAHLWLSEGFATYLTHIYIESKYGTDSLDAEMQKDRQEIIDFGKGYDRPVVDSISSFMSLLNANSYQKGGWVLHMLRRQLGDSIFHLSIKEYYAAYAGKNADTHDLQHIFEKVSGQDLSVFFQQWLYSPGNPKLDVKWKYAAQDKRVALTIIQLQKDLFRFPLRIGLRSMSGKMQVEAVQLNKRTETFFLPAAENISRIIPDPGTSLLFEVSVENIQ